MWTRSSQPCWISRLVIGFFTASDPSPLWTDSAHFFFFFLVLFPNGCRWCCANIWRMIYFKHHLNRFDPLGKIFLRMAGWTRENFSAPCTLRTRGVRRWGAGTACTTVQVTSKPSTFFGDFRWYSKCEIDESQCILYQIFIDFPYY